MLNGRVYGSRRASEAAAEAKKLREKAEPAFVEWGHGKAGVGLGSNASAPSRGGVSSSAADEDGSGMEWVRRRREERERAKRESEMRNSIDGNSSSDERGVLHIHTGRNGQDGKLVTPSINVEELPPTPVIQVSEPTSPMVEMARPVFKKKVTEDHVTQAIQMPRQYGDKGRIGGGDSFEYGDGEGVSPGNSEGEEGSEDDGDGDFDDDDEEEEDIRFVGSISNRFGS
jgi:hypothetical protein